MLPDGVGNYNTRTNAGQTTGWSLQALQPPFHIQLLLLFLLLLPRIPTFINEPKPKLKPKKMRQKTTTSENIQWSHRSIVFRRGFWPFCFQNFFCFAVNDQPESLFTVWHGQLSQPITLLSCIPPLFGAYGHPQPPF